MSVIRKLFIFFFFFNINNFVQSNENIVFVDLDYIFEHSNPGKSILSNLNKINDENIKNLQLKENKLKEQEDQIIKKQNIISVEQFDKEVNLLKDKIKIFRDEKDKMTNEFTNLKKSLISDFFKKINPIVEEYMVEKSVNIIIDKKIIFLGLKTSDATSDILSKINKNFN
ncbi:MAG: hypothetical protein CK535_00525 [Pelagibacteraceae bacterium]|nr:MAG: hypothetical protein CK535_00525 [Pelagibacteraceae bacterium]